MVSGANDTGIIFILRSRPPPEQLERIPHMSYGVGVTGDQSLRHVPAMNALAAGTRRCNRIGSGSVSKQVFEE